MKTLVSFVTGVLLVLPHICYPVPAINPDSTSLLLDGEVDGGFELFVDSSPSPYCVSGPWSAQLQQDDSFSFSGGYDEEPCITSWQVHCSSDSLGIRGSWTTDDPTAYFWNFCFLDCEISARIAFLDDFTLYALSESEGVLESDSHRVAITPENGGEVVLLGPQPGGVAEVDLAAGTYTISLLLDVVEHHTHYDYRANLQVWWENHSGVQQEPSSWAHVKALYR